MEDTLLKVLNIPIATSGNPLGEYTHINNIIGPAIGVGGTIYKQLSNQPIFINRSPSRCCCYVFPLVLLTCQLFRSTIIVLQLGLWPGLVFAPLESLYTGKHIFKSKYSILNTRVKKICVCKLVLFTLQSTSTHRRRGPNGPPTHEEETNPTHVHLPTPTPTHPLHSAMLETPNEKTASAHSLTPYYAPTPPLSPHTPPGRARYKTKSIATPIVP
jgi:hypothetical protein